VDLIEIVPPEQMERFRTDPRFAVAESPSNRLIFLTLDSDRENSPFVRARDGGPIANPLRNRDVRRALSIAINREALVTRVLQGQGLPAGDLGPPGYFGTSPDLTPPPYDPEGARRLLAQAGYPQGFSVQINGPNDRYVNDEQVVQAIAQMWTRIGLNVRVETKTRAVWLSEAAAREAIGGRGGCGAMPSGPAWSGLASQPLPPAVASEIRAIEEEIGERQGGAAFRGRNPAMLAAVASGLLLAALALWHFTGRAGLFPDEIVRIATAAGKAIAADFSPVQAPARDIPDWFALKGMDSVKIPEELGGLEAVGVRSFQHEGEVITQVAALDGERRVYLLSFAAEPFGLSLPQSGAWIYKQAGRYALAASGEGKTCLVVSMPGEVGELRSLLNRPTASSPQPSPAP
ncbi:MAG: ABC transporter substrate-binding protein, partial [Terrimicrobiaceae bacterium]|nr:ABC transporter substrate-binding protein [Terrimicrobiaceae bacterium]